MKKLFISVTAIFLAAVCSMAQSRESDRLFAIGVEKYNAGDYNDAIGYFERVDILDTAELDSISPRNGYGKLWLASCWYKLGDIEKAKTFEGTFYKLPPIDRRLTVETDSLELVAFNLFNTEGPQASINLLLEAQRKGISIFGEDHYWFIGNYNSLAIVYGYMGDVDKSLEYINRDIELRRKWLDDNYNFSDIYLYACNMLLSAGRYDLFKDWIDRAEDSVVRFYGTDSDKNFQVLDLKLYYHVIKKEWNLAEKLIKDYRKIIERRFGKGSINEKNFLANMANLFEQAGRDKETAYYRKEISRLGEATIDNYEKRYYQLMAELAAANDLFKSGEFKKSIKRFDKLISETKNLTDSVSRAVFWSSKGGRSMAYSMIKKKDNDHLSFDDYQQAKSEFKELGSLIGYLYVLENVFFRSDYSASQDNDILITVLRDVTPGFLALSNNLLLGAQSMSQIALLYAMLGQVSESRKFSAEAKAYYMSLINMPSAAHSYEKLSVELKSQISMMDNYIDDEDNRYFSSKQSDNDLRYDSISYASHKVRANLLECKLQLDLKTENGANEINHDFSDYYVDMGIYCKDSITARTFMSDYLQKIEDKFGKGDVFNDAMYYYVQMFPKGSEEGKALYEELLAAQKETGSYWYIHTLENYYKFISDKDALVRLKVDNLTGSPTNVLSSKFYIYRDAGMQADALDAIEGYFALYPDSETETGTMASMLGYVLSINPDKACETISGLLDKAEANGDKDFLVDFMVNILLGDISKDCSDDTKNQFRQFVSQQIETRPAFNADPSLNFHLRLYETSLFDRYKESESITFMLSKLLYETNDNSPDMAEIIYTNAMWNANNYHGSMDIEDIRSAIAYFEGNEALKNTSEYKTLLIALSEKLSEEYNSTELVALYEKISGLNPTVQLCTDFLDRYGLRQSINEYKIMSLLRRGYNETIDLDKYTKALERSGRINDLKPMLVKTFGNRLNEINIDLKRSYINWEETAGKASELAGTIARYAIRYPDADSLAILAYDASMLCKGMLLRAEGGLYSLLATSDNASISEKYKAMQELKARLEEARKEGAATDELQRNYNLARREMIDHANRLGNFTSSLQFTSKDVARKLSSDDVAIEFMSSTDESQTTTYYAAVMRGGDTPRLIQLCTAAELDAVSSPYTTDEIYRLIWNPIESLLASEKSGSGPLNIYFAPTGILHQLAVEYVPTSDGQLISQRHNLFRLSNTAELLKDGRNRTSTATTKLYGGIIYDEGNVPLISGSGKRGAVAGIEYLPGTEEEVMSISRELDGSKYDVTVVTGSDATEMSVKELSGSGISVLHLATHGFYTPDNGDDSSAEANDPLAHSGLYMAGAAGAVSGYEVGDVDNDGILTAKDIAELDFSDADLVVLSACQTALGAVSDEGVFGLQRGFKKAGVGSLLMSLWPVDDEATRILMTRFYHNLANNSSKREALKEAQDYLRTVDDGFFDDPDYWAAFILLDAVK